MKELEHKASDSRIDSTVREFFISQISAGYINYTINGKTLQIRYPSVAINYESLEVYLKYLEQGKSKGLPDSDEVLSMLVEFGLWTEKDDDKMRFLPDHIDYFKTELFRAVYNPQKVKQLRSYLLTAEKELDGLFERRYAYDHVTAHGTANFARWLYVITHSTFYDDKQFTWSFGNPNSVLNYYFSRIISEKKMRELARTTPWSTIWHSSRDMTIFPCPLNLDQQRLICWSKFYDSISEAYNRPISKVVEDDDMLDGWLILEKRKREEEDRKKFNEEKFGTAKGDEVFIVVETEEEAKEVYSMNSQRNQNIVRQRLKTIEEKGLVTDLDFADVRQKVMMQANNAYRDMVMNKK